MNSQNKQVYFSYDFVFFLRICNLWGTEVVEVFFWGVLPDISAKFMSLFVSWGCSSGGCISRAWVDFNWLSKTDEDQHRSYRSIVPNRDKNNSKNHSETDLLRIALLSRIWKLFNDVVMLIGIDLAKNRRFSITSNLNIISCKN